MSLSTACSAFDGPQALQHVDGLLAPFELRVVANRPVQPAAQLAGCPSPSHSGP